MTLPLPAPNVAIADSKGLPSTVFYSWLKSLTQPTTGGTGGTGGGPAVDLRLGVNIIDHGGDNSGATDNSTALANSFAALGGAGGTIYFPAGRYKFTAAVTLTYPGSNALYNLSLIGDGADATTLVWTSGGLTINFVGPPASPPPSRNNQSFHARELSITTTGSGASNGLNLHQTAGNNGNYAALTELTRVAIKGDGGYGAASGSYWANGLVLTGISNVNIMGCYFEGSGSSTTRLGGGITMAGLSRSPLDVAVVFNCVASQFNLLNVGFNFGDFLQGITFDSCNFDCSTAINNPASLSAPAIDSQLSVTNCQFAQNVTGNCIFIGTALNATLITNNLFLINSSAGAFSTGGIDIATLSGTIIHGNHFITAPLVANSTGVSVANGVATTGATITENLFGGFDGTGSLPILVASSAKDCIVANNCLFACNPISNLGNAGTTIATQLNNVSGGFAFLIGNQNGGANTHGIAIPCGRSGATSDTGSVVLSFANGDSTVTIGSVTRNGSTGVAYNGSVGVTGGGTPTFGTNCPAITPGSVYKWAQCVLSDGSAVFIPCWK